MEMKCVKANWQLIIQLKPSHPGLVRFAINRQGCLQMGSGHYIGAATLIYCGKSAKTDICTCLTNSYHAIDYQPYYSNN